MRLQDMQCSVVSLKPGDRVFVKVKVNLDRQQRDSIRRAVQRWAGKDIEVLIVDLRAMELDFDTAQSLGQCNTG